MQNRFLKLVGIIVSIVTLASQPAIAAPVPGAHTSGSFIVGKSASSPAGVSVGGMVIALTSAQSALQRNEPLRLTVEVRNVSSTDISVPFVWLSCAYGLTFTNSTRVVRAYRGTSCDVYGGQDFTIPADSLRS